LVASEARPPIVRDIHVKAPEQTTAYRPGDTRHFPPNFF
jgi:hypothetical protein